MSRLSYSETRDGMVPGVSEESGGKRKRAQDDDGDNVAEAEANGGSGGAASPGADALSSYSLMGVADGSDSKDAAGGVSKVETEAAVTDGGPSSSSGEPSSSADGDAGAGADPPAAGDDDEVVEIPPPSAAQTIVEVLEEADCGSGGFNSAAPGTAAAPISIESREAPQKKSKGRKSKKKQKSATKDLEAQQEDSGGSSGSAGSGEQRPSKKARKSAGAKAEGSDGGSEGGSEDDDASEGGDTDGGSGNGRGDDGSNGNGSDGDGGDSGGGDGLEGPVLFTVGEPMSKKMRKMAKGRLSKWALKFTGTRTYAPPAVPVIEPINDDYLASFGRSYAEAKSLTAQDKTEKTATQDKDDDDDDGGGDGGGYDSSSGDEEGPSDDKATVAVKPDAEDGSAAKAEGSGSPTKKNSLSGGRKKHGVFVVNLLYTLCDETKLKSLFGAFGRVTAVVLTRAPEGKKVSGSASVYFATSEGAQKALAADGMDIQGRSVGIREVRLNVDKRYFVEPEQAAKATNTAKSPLEDTRCTLCGAIGHDDKNCPFNACSRCWEEGHLAEACPYVDVMEEGPEPYCSVCGKAGHSIDACETAHKGKSQLKFSCITCRDDGHTQCGRETNLVFGNEKGDAMTCCNCGLERHDRRSCHHQTEAEILRECGYRFNSSANGGNRRKSTGGGGRTNMTCYNCGKQGHGKSECPEQRQTQTPGRFGTNNYNRNDQPRVPAADWKREWSASSNNTLSFNSLNHNHGSGKFRNGPMESSQQHQHQPQQPTHLPSAYLNDLAQPPSPLLPTRRDGGAAAFSGPPSPPHHHRNHDSHHNGRGYHQHQQERGGTHNRYQHQMATPTDTRSSFPRRGDDATVSAGGSGSGTLHRAYHPGGNFGSDSSGGSRRRVEDRHRSSGHRGERYSSSRGGGDRYSGGRSSGGQKGGYHSYNQHQPAPTPSPSYSHHSSGSHQRSRYNSGQPYSAGGHSHSAGRRGGGARDSHANPRSYGY